MLVVIDNFEDYQHPTEDGEGPPEMTGGNWTDEGDEFISFLDTLASPNEKCLSKIIVTTRSEFLEASSFSMVRVKELERERQRYELFEKRYNWLVEQRIVEDKASVSVQIKGMRYDADRQRAWRELEENIGEGFRKNLQHPQIIIIFAKEITDKLIEKPELKLWEATREIIDGDEGRESFKDVIKNHEKWIMDRSIQKHVRDNPVRKAILTVLYKRFPMIISANRLHEELDIEPKPTRRETNDELGQIRADAIFKGIGTLGAANFVCWIFHSFRHCTTAIIASMD